MLVECFEYLYCLACFCCFDLYVMLYVSLGSRVSPSILGLMFMRSVICLFVVQVVCCILLGLV